jgi:hypothetical protein
MDGLNLVCPPSINSYKADQQNVQKRPLAVGTCSVASFTARNFPGSNVRGQSRNKALANKATKLNELSSNSSHRSSFICSNSSGLNQNGSKANIASDIFVDSSQVDKAVKRNSRKKGRKKGKQSRKLSCDSGSTEPEILSEEYAHGSLTSEICDNNGMDHGNGPVSSVAPEVLLPDVMVDGNSLEGSSNGIISETPKTCGSYADEVDVSETIAHSAAQNYTGDPVCSSDYLYQAKDLSVFDGGVGDTRCIRISRYDGTYSKGLSDAHDSLMLDSVSIASNTDDGIHASHDVQQSEKDSCRIHTSQPPGFNSSKGYLSRLSSLNGVVDTYDPIERKKCGSQDSSCSDIQVVVPGKRGKQNKTVSRSSSVYRFGSVGRFHDRTGKENSHSVWQKVQKNDANGCIGELKKASPICSQFDVTLKEAPLLKRTCNVEGGLLSKSEDKKHLKDKASRKLKRKNSPALKQEYGYSRKGFDADKACSNGFAKISPQVSNQKGLISVSRSHSQINLHEATCLSNRVGYMTSESVHSTLVYPDELESLGSVCSTVSSINSHHIGNHEFSLPKSCDSLDQSNLLEVQSPVYIPHLLVNEIGLVQKETSVAEYRKQNHGNGSILQKWIPIGVKDRGFTNAARSDWSSLEHSDVPAADLENTVEGKMSSNSQNIFSSSTAGVMCMGQNSGDVSSALEDDGHTQKLGSQGAGMLNEHDNKHVAANFFTDKSTDQHPLETNSYKIGRAASDACRVQLASEAIQMATGGPIAEFERLLDLSSPAVSASSSFTSCQTCLRDQDGGVLLCRHEIPNVPLGCLWQWYEKHGSYGLEIRAEDFDNSKRLGVDGFAFRAYFVPFLSAVQLFRDRRSYPADTSKDIPSFEVPEACKTSETSEKSSNLDHLPIFSVLFPQPRTKDESGPQFGNQVCGSEQSPASGKDDASVQSIDMKCSSDFELLFEYFESEQPQQRRPLYEKYVIFLFFCVFFTYLSIYFLLEAELINANEL